MKKLITSTLVALTLLNPVASMAATHHSASHPRHSHHSRAPKAGMKRAEIKMTYLPSAKEVKEKQDYEMLESDAVDGVIGASLGALSLISGNPWAAAGAVTISASSIAGRHLMDDVDPLKEVGGVDVSKNHTYDKLTSKVYNKHTHKARTHVIHYDYGADADPMDVFKSIIGFLTQKDYMKNTHMTIIQPNEDLLYNPDSMVMTIVDGQTAIQIALDA